MNAYNRSGYYLLYYSLPITTQKQSKIGFDMQHYTF